MLLLTTNNGNKHSICSSINRPNLAIYFRLPGQISARLNQKFKNYILKKQWSFQMLELPSADDGLCSSTDPRLLTQTKSIFSIVQCSENKLQFVRACTIHDMWIKGTHFRNGSQNNACCICTLIYYQRAPRMHPQGQGSIFASYMDFDILRLIRKLQDAVMI